MSTVVGLDLSLTSTGLVVLGASGVVRIAETIKSRKKDMPRLAELQAEILAKGSCIVPFLWVLEGYAFGMSRGNSVANLAELGGIIKLQLHQRGDRYMIIPPARLKKFVVGRGNAKKDEMRLHVYKRWGFEHPSNDVVDAYALARVGLAVLGYDDKLTKEQAAVVDQLREVV